MHSAEFALFFIKCVCVLNRALQFLCQGRTLFDDDLCHNRTKINGTDCINFPLTERFPILINLRIDIYLTYFYIITLKQDEKD
jgi:hypothetical protein